MSGASRAAHGPFKTAAPNTDEISSALLLWPIPRNQQEAKAKLVSVSPGANGASLGSSLRGEEGGGGGGGERNWSPPTSLSLSLLCWCVPAETELHPAGDDI